RLEQDATPAEIFDHPASEFVARFVGDVNVLDVRVQDGVAHAGALSIPLPAGREVMPSRVVIRSHDLVFARSDDGVAVVRRLIPLGDRVRVEASVDGGVQIFAHVPRRTRALDDLAPGSRVSVKVAQARAYAD
ncbi:MAG TPA: TOBE domain-containing protein, partial [Longimicrobiales bacterium]